MPTTKRAVIRSYDRALQILRDEGGVLRVSSGCRCSLSWGATTATLAFATFDKLAPHLQERSRTQNGTYYIFAVRESAAKREVEQAAERQRRGCNRLSMHSTTRIT